MPTLSRTSLIKAPAERVFAYVDDIRNLARHMSESRSMPMMGSKLKLEIMTPELTGVGATYRYSGKMMGLTIDFSETVTKYVAGCEKVIGSEMLTELAPPRSSMLNGSSSLSCTTRGEGRRKSFWRRMRGTSGATSTLNIDALLEQV